MFRFFKRNKIENWEIELLRNVVIKLPKKYSSLINQIDNGLFRGVLLDASDIPGFVAFTYHHDVLKKYDNKNERDYKLTNIKVYDNQSSCFLSYEIYVSSGTISGYSIVESKKHKIDLNRIKISDFKEEFIGESDYNRIVKIFDEKEKKAIIPSEVYAVFLENKEYFQIKELDDGDFIGVDINKVVYKITHDPMEIIKIDKTITEVLK